MPFTLRIYMTGLCLFVPDPAPPDLDRGPRLHALLLKNGHNGHNGENGDSVHGRHRHFPRLIYNVRYEKETPERDNHPHLRCKRLDGRLLNFESLGEAIDPERGFGHPEKPGKLPDEIADLDEISAVGRLDRSLLGLNPDHQIVSARVTIFDGRYHDRQKPASWTVREPSNPSAWPRDLTTLVAWEIPDINQDSLTLKLRSLRTGRAEDYVTLYPYDADIKISIFNATLDDLPPQAPKCIQEGDPAEHFEAYYRPFGSEVRDHPQLDEQPTHPNRDPTPSDCKHPPYRDEQTGGGSNGLRTSDTPTCLTAQARAD